MSGTWVKPSLILARNWLLRPVRTAVWLLDEILDCVPSYESGRWYRYGAWGCRLHLSRFWWPEDG